MIALAAALAISVATVVHRAHQPRTCPIQQRLHLGPVASWLAAGALLAWALTDIPSLDRPWALALLAPALLALSILVSVSIRLVWAVEDRAQA